MEGYGDGIDVDHINELLGCKKISYIQKQNVELRDGRKWHQADAYCPVSIANGIAVELHGFTGPTIKQGKIYLSEKETIL